MVSLSILCEKDIISLETGQNIGCADDIEFDEKTAKVENLVIFGRPKFFGLLGREKDFKISWSQIHMIGKDVVLIKQDKIVDTVKSGKTKIEY